MNIAQPHDHLVRFVWADLPTARAHLASALPAELSAGLDWDTLELKPGTFVDEALRDLHTDLHFVVQTLAGSPLTIFVLFEHLRTPDVLIRFRLLRYLVRMWDVQLRGGPGSRLSPIVPLVLYQGRVRWPRLPTLSELMALDAATSAQYERFIPTFDVLVQDLSTLEDAEIRGTALGRMALLLLKHCDDGDLWERLPAWLETFVAVRDTTASGLQAIEALLRYMMYVSSVRPGPEVRKLIGQRLGPATEDKLMTWAQQLVEEGRQEGRQEGVVESILLVLAARHRLDDPGSLRARLSQLPVPTLQALVKPAIESGSLSAFLNQIPSQAQ